MRTSCTPGAALVEDSLRTLGQPEIPADEVGVAIQMLRELDQVAYLRFACLSPVPIGGGLEAEIALACGAGAHRD